MTRLLILSVVATLYTACGNEADFRGGAPQSMEAVPVTTPTPPPPVVVPEPEEPEDLALTWQWDCLSENEAPTMSLADNGKGKAKGKQEEDNMPSNDDARKKTKLYGSGRHQITISKSDVVNLSIDGRMCQASSYYRDIVFAVDVSGSMRGNDPSADDGSCGRMRALEELLMDLEEPSRTRVGLVTFDGEVKAATQTLMPVDQFLRSSFFRANILCANEDNTNYQAALNKAIDLMADAQQNSVREVFFISDGDPNDGKEGVQEAEILKDPLRIGATIVTLMIQGDDEKLKQLSSRDALDRPLHARTENVANIASLLKELSQTSLVKATFSYRSKGTDIWYDEDLLYFENQDTFNVDLPEFSKEHFPKGLEFQMSYEDNFGNQMIEKGSIDWQ